MYVPSHGGAEISAYSILKNLKNKFNYDILTITDERYEKTINLTGFNEIRLHTVTHNNREREIEEKILEFKPNIIVTQLMWSDVALKLAKKYSIPSIMRVCKVPIEISLAKNSEYAPTAIISTSKFVKDYVLKHWDRESTIINPLVQIEDYLITKKDFLPFKNELIFIFNPLERKGGLVFREIAKQLPSLKFGTVFGWSSLKDNPDSNAFSKEYIKRITESEGSVFDGSLPEYVNFNDCPNIQIFSSADDPKKLYEKIKILLIPSQWEEAFGRVAIEAMANRIPVLASDVAGLRDSVGDGGILLEKDNVDKWVKAIQGLFSDEKYFNTQSEKGKEFVKNNYSQEEIINKTKDLIESIANK